MMGESEFMGLAAAILSAVSWSLGSILFSRLGKRLSADAMTAGKGVLSLVFLAIASVFTWDSGLDAEVVWLLVLSGLLGIALGDTLFFSALKRITPHAVVTLMMCGHVLTVVGAVFFLSERPTALAWVGIAFVLAGVIVVLRNDAGGEEDEGGAEGAPGRSRAAGIIFGLLSVCAMAASILVAKRALETAPTMQATFIRMASGTLCMMAFGLVSGRLGRWGESFRDAALSLRFAFAVCVITFGGFWLSLYAFKYAPVSVANTLLATEPIFVLVLSRVLLGTPVRGMAVAGSILTVAGVACILLGGPSQ